MGRFGTSGGAPALSNDIFRYMPFEPRRLTDPRDMRALAHPLRLSLIELLGRAGELTATEAAEHVDASPSACSFHLRQLAKYGFVEEGEPVAGRRRPWRLTRVGLVFGDQSAPDAETEAASSALSRVMTDRYLERAGRALAARDELAPEWRRVSGTSQSTLYVTPDELEQLDRELVALLTRYHDRLVDPAQRPDGARAIEALLLTYPLD
jgi:predicted ArsR family transcriptional regulator